jgi:hypothetical protein
MSLLDRIAEILGRQEIPFALIGASALAAHGVQRSTKDQDLLTVDPSSLQPELWRSLRDAGIEIEIRKGDLFDPLLGVVRFSAPGERPIDLVVGKSGWQRDVLERAAAGPIPVVRAADLILLKLYAAGLQDAWDIQQLLEGDDRESLIAEVEKGISRLPREGIDLWRKILG